MTGWGQDGPWSQSAGHDMNYVAITGALHGLGQDPARPHFPTNLLGDFGGGSTYLVIGVLAALLEARLSGRGQVVDAAIVDGTAHLNAMATTFAALGLDTGRRRSGLLDGGTPYYDLYETADGQHMSVGPLEPQFYAEMVRLLELDLPDRDDPANLPAIRDALTARFKERTQAEWSKLFDGTDACVAPVVPARRRPAAPAPRRARHLRRAGRDHPARPGAALLPHARVPRHGARRARRPHPRGADRVGRRGRRRPAGQRRRDPGVSGVRPFLFLGTRAEDDVAQQEYDAVLAGAGLHPDELVRVRLEERPLGAVDLDDWSGIVLGGGPFNASDPDELKSPVQHRVEAELHALAERVDRGRLPLPRRLLRHRRCSAPWPAASWTGRTASPSARCPSG